MLKQNVLVFDAFLCVYVHYFNKNYAEFVMFFMNNSDGISRTLNILQVTLKVYPKFFLPNLYNTSLISEFAVGFN